MKQYITAEQLEELGEVAKSNLREWWHKTSYFKDNENPILHNYYGTIPLLSIGQMIEFLDEKKNTDHFMPLAIDIGEHEWHVYSISDKPSFRSVELCDALWKAVKEKLEEKE